MVCRNRRRSGSTRRSPHLTHSPEVAGSTPAPATRKPRSDVCLAGASAVSARCSTVASAGASTGRRRSGFRRRGRFGLHAGQDMPVRARMVPSLLAAFGKPGRVHTGEVSLAGMSGYWMGVTLGVKTMASTCWERRQVMIWLSMWVMRRRRVSSRVRMMTGRSWWRRSRLLSVLHPGFSVPGGGSQGLALAP